MSGVAFSLRCGLASLLCAALTGFGLPLEAGAATKLGPIGIGPEHRVGPDQRLPYLIRFENLATATVPVQSAVVTDVLDVGRLDLSTLSLGPIRFGRRTNGHPWTVDPGSGSISYTADVDLRPEQDWIVRVYASLDEATGVLGWSLTALDPATGKPPTDPLAGFLPPNVTPPEGEVSVVFDVAQRPGLANGTLIRNRATVSLDGISTITPEWTNTLDSMSPESHVLPLAAQQDSASFTVRWEATGSPSDLRDFSVYVSTDNGPFVPWRLATSATADLFSGAGGHVYAFYSLARDSCGNLELAPASPDAQTYSSPNVAVDPAGHWTLSLEGVRPNPAPGSAYAWFTLPSGAPARLEVLDLQGRRWLQREVGSLGPGRHSVNLRGAVREPGIYVVRLAQGASILVARFAVIR